MMSKHLVLCPNTQRDRDLLLTKRAKQLLEEAGYRVYVSLIRVSPCFPDRDYGVKTVPISDVIENASLLIAFGGDGTILHTARAAIEYRVPIIGVNMGNRGFMADVEPDKLEKLVEAAAGNCTLETRMMLDVQLIRDGEVIYSDTALNDALVSGVVKLIKIAAYGDDRQISNFYGDGVIVATPTGSTAYSMAAGGPLVEPLARNIILTPVCAHDFYARSFVLEQDRVVTLRVKELGDKRAVLSVDGGDTIDLRMKDIIKVRKSGYETILAHIENKSFYDIVYEKLGDRT